MRYRGPPPCGRGTIASGERESMRPFAFPKRDPIPLTGAFAAHRCCRSDHAGPALPEPAAFGDGAKFGPGAAWLLPTSAAD